MQTSLRSINQSPWYWAALLAFGVGALGAALYFQHVMNEWPCLLCIHARIWVLGVVLVAGLGWMLRRHLLGNALAHGLLLVMAGGLLERSWLLLGTERGTVFGECSMELGLPAWFALDRWLPWLFEVQASCGYTPELWPGVSMAEALLLISMLLLLLASLQLLSLLFDVRSASR